MRANRILVLNASDDGRNIVFKIEGLDREEDGVVLDDELCKKVKVGEYLEAIVFPDFYTRVRKINKKEKSIEIYDGRHPEFDPGYIGDLLCKGEIISIGYFLEEFGEGNKKYFLEVDCGCFYIILDVFLDFTVIREKDLEKFKVGDYISFVAMTNWVLKDPNIPHKVMVKK